MILHNTVEIALKIQFLGSCWRMYSKIEYWLLVPMFKKHSVASLRKGTFLFFAQYNALPTFKSFCEITSSFPLWDALWEKTTLVWRITKKIINLHILDPGRNVYYNIQFFLVLKSLLEELNEWTRLEVSHWVRIFYNICQMVHKQTSPYLLICKSVYI